MNSNELLDALKKHNGLTSDYALAREVLKVDQTTLTAMRRRGLSEERALQIATLLGMDPGEVLATIRAERADDPAVKKVWEKVAKTIRSAAAAVLVILGMGVTAPEPLQAAQSAYPAIHYAKSRLRRAWAALRALAGAFSFPAYTIAPGGIKNMTKGLAAIPLALLATTANADLEWSLNINGLSWHAESRDYNGEKFNSVNAGVGVQITQPVIDQPNTFIHWTAGTLINSMNDRTWYAGPTFIRRWGDAWRFEAGLFFGLVTYPSYERGWLIAPAPFLSVGTQRIGLNASIMPPVGELPAAALLQLRIGL